MCMEFLIGRSLKTNLCNLGLDGDYRSLLSSTVDSQGKLFVGETPTTMEDLKGRLSKAVADDPEVNVLVRGDVRVEYGNVYEVVKIAKDANVRHLGLVSKEN